jgi:hypothetical protein
MREIDWRDQISSGSFVFFVRFAHHRGRRRRHRLAAIMLRPCCVEPPGRFGKSAITTGVFGSIGEDWEGKNARSRQNQNPLATLDQLLPP